MRLRNSFFLLAAATLLAGSLTPVRALVIAMPRDVPDEILVTEADLIVTATVAALPVPATAPAAGGPVAAPALRIRRGVGGLSGPVTFKVTKALANRTGEELEGKDINVTVNTFGAANPAALKVGDKVVLALKRNNGQYYTLPYAKSFSTNVDTTVAALSKSLDLDKWNWGKETNGLRAVALKRNVQVNPTNDKAMMQISIGLRNVTKESIYVNTFPGDQPLSLKAFWDGTPVTSQIPGNNGGFGVYQAAYTVEVKPGAVVWLSQWGVSPEGTNFSVDSPEGKCDIAAVYSASRDAAAPSGSKLWQGTVTSGTITVEVSKAAKPAAGGPRVNPLTTAQ